MIETIKEMLIGTLFIVFLIGLPVLLTLSGVYYVEKRSCSDKSTMMELDSHHSIFTGCMVKNGGQWQPFNKYITVNNQHD